MKKCAKCKEYTLEKAHCGIETASPHPPKFSIDDKYADYRRKAKSAQNGDIS